MDSRSVGGSSWPERSGFYHQFNYAMHQSHHQQAIHIDVCSIRISLSLPPPTPLCTILDSWCAVMLYHGSFRRFCCTYWLRCDPRTGRKKWPITQAWSVTKNRIPWASKNPWQLQLTIFGGVGGGGTSTLWVYFFIYSIGNNSVDFKSICGDLDGGGGTLTCVLTEVKRRKSK